LFLDKEVSMKFFNIKLFMLAIFSFLFSSCQKNISSQKDFSLKEGVRAPDFSAPDETGKVHTLADYKGKKLVLYFYPKDNTPGCTKEACAFRDGIEEFRKNGIEVIGVSTDSVKQHKKFKEKHRLPFALLSDPQKQIIKAYQAVGMLWTKRITYLVDEHQTIVKIYYDVDPVSHAKEILSFFTEK
jgi:thioredoxin-dependent peroxiredoxin